MMIFRSDLKTIAPLVKLSNLLAITPPYVFGVQPEPCSKAFKLYSAGVLVVLLTGYIGCVYGKLHNQVLKQFDIVSKIVDFVAASFLAMANTSIVITALLKGAKFQTLLFTIEKFDHSIGLNSGCNKRRFWVAYICFQLTTLSTILIDAIAWITAFDLEAYASYIPRNIMWYQFNLTTFLIFWLVLEITKRFREINCLLIRCAKGVNSSFLIPSLLYEYSIVKRNDKPFYIKVPDTCLLRSIKFWYNDIINVIDDFNSTFGCTLLFTVLFNIANVVNYTEALMLHVVYNKLGTDFGGAIIAVSLMWIIMAALQIILIAAACEGLTNEGSRITEICYTLLSEVPSLPKTEYGVCLREELLLLAEQTAISHPKVSAAGFFEVNLGMMGFIVASVTSYIIVTIQFK